MFTVGGGEQRANHIRDLERVSPESNLVYKYPRIKYYFKTDRLGRSLLIVNTRSVRINSI